MYPSPLLTVSESDWDLVMAVNVKGPLFTCQAVLPHMIERGSGAIVNIASDSAFDVVVDEGPYGISKIALVRMSSYFARELAGKGVRVNSLAPGWVKTRLTDEFFADPDASRAILDEVPARRVAEPADIAGVVVFLASDLANYVNGHCIVVDGGRIAGVPA
jgi:NAD(P)-dependent dehydrogenase (short-subunit alcohol dehydrogenase family)